ncbi:MAG: HNH endonuclease [Oscillospiraceae bacterium]
MLAAYDDRCFISGCALPQMLVASHIKPYSQCRSEADRVSPDNGICLNTFYDKAFDRGLITITPSMKIYVSPIILDSPQDAFTARWLASLDGMVLPPPPRFPPRRELLEYHNDEILGGSHEYSNLCSVSAGPRQTDQSIEGQLRVCTDFCKQRGLTVIHILRPSYLRPHRRATEFQRLIADAKRKKFEAVVVYRRDRFARNKYDSAVYKRSLRGTESKSFMRQRRYQTARGHYP